MKCNGKFKFKGLNVREGGEFTNDKGQVIKYDECYKLKVDECTDNGIYERYFTIAKDSPLVQRFKNMELYKDIDLEFDIKMYGNRITVVPINLK